LAIGMPANMTASSPKKSAEIALPYWLTDVSHLNERRECRDHDAEEVLKCARSAIALDDGRLSGINPERCDGPHGNRPPA
jgi:hypothetical protein